MHPDVAALIAGAGQPPPQIQVDPSQHPQNQTKSFADAIDATLADLRAALQATDATAAEKLTVEKVTTLLQGITATHEKEQQAALGGGPATNFLRRASGGPS